MMEKPLGNCEGISLIGKKGREGADVQGGGPASFTPFQGSLLCCLEAEGLLDLSKPGGATKSPQLDPNELK